jgi:hypothetical protein
VDSVLLFPLRFDPNLRLSENFISGRGGPLWAPADREGTSPGEIHSYIGELFGQPVHNLEVKIYKS